MQGLLSEFVMIIYDDNSIENREDDADFSEDEALHLLSESF